MLSSRQNLISVVELLNDLEYHDGTSIGEQLNMTRAGVWKIIKKLEEYGVEIDSIKGKGYALKRPLFLLDPKKIKLNDKSVQLEVLEKTNSTNDAVKNNINEKATIKACLAELQTQGRGRLSRVWHSPFGSNINLSLAYPFYKDISELSGLSLVVGLAVSQAIESCLSDPIDIKLKWPNDIIVKQQKLGGILIEIQAESNGYCQAIIGIGVNVNMQKATKKQIEQPWASLLNITKKHQDRNQLAAAIISHVLSYLERFCEEGLSSFKKEWQQKDNLHGQDIAVSIGNNQFKGIASGINDHGHLLIKNDSAKLQAFSSGDATLLK